MILILSDDAKQDVGKKLYAHLKETNTQVTYISVSNLNISTCYNCDACHTKEYGKCAIKDDMQDLLYQAAKSTQLILVSPLTWGSYSSKMKKIFDRLAVLGDTHYYVVNGELVKGTVTSQNGLWAIGVKDNCSSEEATLFINLAEENRKILNLTGKGFVLSENPSKDELNNLTEVILHV